MEGEKGNTDREQGIDVERAEGLFQPNPAAPCPYSGTPPSLPEPYSCTTAPFVQGC